MLAEARSSQGVTAVAVVVLVALLASGRTAPADRDAPREEFIEMPVVRPRVAMAMMAGGTPACAAGGEALVQFANITSNADFTAVVSCAELTRLRRAQLLGVEPVYRLELRELFTYETGLHHPYRTVTRIDDVSAGR